MKAFLYPKLSSEIVLSAGADVGFSTFCAVSEGRAMGNLQATNSDHAENKRQELRERAGKEGLDEVEVKGFHLKLKDGQAMIICKPKKVNDAALKERYGEEECAKLEAAFGEALQDWKGNEVEWTCSL